MRTMLMCSGASRSLLTINSSPGSASSHGFFNASRALGRKDLGLGLPRRTNVACGARVSGARGEVFGCNIGCGGNRLKAICALGSSGSGLSRKGVPDAQFYKVLLGASVAARVVLAFSSQHSHSSTHSHGGHDHYHSHEPEEKEEHDHAHGSCDHDHDHSHSHSHSHSHEEHHTHSHGCGHSHGHSTTLNAVQKLIKRASEVLGIAAIADSWRENLTAVCVSTVLLLLGAVLPLVLPRVASYQNLLVIPALPLTGVPALLDATIDVAGGNVNIHVLMAFAALASVVMGSALEGGLLLAMFSLSHLAEDYFTAKAMGDVKALKDRNPEFALVLDDFNEKKPPPLTSVPYKQLPVKDVAVGAYVLVKAGEVVPVDGDVYEGKATVTVEHLTGESTPVEKQVGDTIPGGARNLDGIMIVKATRVWSESTVARIMKLTQDAQSNSPKLERWLDEFTERYSQLVLAMSVAVALLGPLLFKWPFLTSQGVRGSLYRALGLMVAASPCALAVAPLAYATAVSACARKGILLKGGEVLDALAVCDTVAFDKTGTLTTGELRCKAIEPLRGHDLSVGPCCTPSCEGEALAVAAAMERGATHPIARAVVDHSLGKSLPGVEVENFESIPGQGLAAEVNVEVGEKANQKARLGSLEYVASSQSTPSEASKIREAAGKSAYSKELVQAALSVDKKVTLFHFEDELRKNAAAVVDTLKVLCGLRVLMLTGDNPRTAERVAKLVKIEEFHAGLKPEDKLSRVQRLTQEKDCGGLVMVGDGINDGPALAAATVGIVLAKNASATAVQVADVLLLQNEIDGVPFVIAKAHQTTSLVKQSVALALFSIFLAGLPSVLGVLPLWLAVLMHEGGTLLVCANSVRAFKNPSYKLNRWNPLKGVFSSNSKGGKSSSPSNQPTAPVPS
ncbi:hypothetical protein KC19_4G216200 [Ceratodon purpureus]|uniref:P-type ATPase A domain-containing protein n=1 Tax=Ceratodon purpureus TaxID=3225 RepID=A0A8T0IDQ8_CERPU|nr:hypothetical protein KC19_4G216200 [Ceratodon purpureus]